MSRATWMNSGNSRWPRHGRHGGGGAATLSSTLDVAGDVDVGIHGGLNRATRQWQELTSTLSSTLDVAGDVDVNSEIHGGLNHGQHGGGGDAERRGDYGGTRATAVATLSSTLDVAGDVDVNSGKFAVAIGPRATRFTLAGGLR